MFIIMLVVCLVGMGVNLWHPISWGTIDSGWREKLLILGKNNVIPGPSPSFSDPTPSFTENSFRRREAVKKQQILSKNTEQGEGKENGRELQAQERLLHLQRWRKPWYMSQSYVKIDESALLKKGAFRPLLGLYRIFPSLTHIRFST